MKDVRRTLGVILVTAMMLFSIGYAAAATTEYVSTEYYFTIISTVAFSVILPDDASFESDPTNETTWTTDIEFNTTNATNLAVDPYIKGTSTQQDTNTPIFNITNDGTAALNMTIWLGEPMAGCIVMGGSTAYATRATDEVINQTPTVTIATDLTSGGFQHYFLAANFTSCTPSDSTAINGTIAGTNEG